MLIVGNWKAYVEDTKVAKQLLVVAKKYSTKGAHEIVLAPSAPYIGMLAEGNRSNVSFAAQDVSNTTGGAETGEVTAAAYAAAGATYAILGHSERRARGDTDAIVASKVQHALAHSLTPILCIGERVRDPEALYLRELRQQITSVYEILTPKERLSMVIAYEPVWAIGPHATAAITPHDLEEMIRYIRKILSDLIPGRACEKVGVLYGGSVDPTNISELAQGTGIDGFLIGRASAHVDTFTKILQALS